MSRLKQEQEKLKVAHAKQAMKEIEAECVAHKNAALHLSKMNNLVGDEEYLKYAEDNLKKSDCLMVLNEIKKGFIFRYLVHWFQKYNFASNHYQAVDLGQRMLDAGLISKHMSLPDTDEGKAHFEKHRMSFRDHAIGEAYYAIIDASDQANADNLRRSEEHELYCLPRVQDILKKFLVAISRDEKRPNWKDEGGKVHNHPLLFQKVAMCIDEEFAAISMNNERHIGQSRLQGAGNAIQLHHMTDVRQRLADMARTSHNIRKECMGLSPLEMYKGAYDHQDRFHVRVIGQEIEEGDFLVCGQAAVDFADAIMEPVCYWDRMRAALLRNHCVALSPTNDIRTKVAENDFSTFDHFECKVKNADCIAAQRLRGKEGAESTEVTATIVDALRNDYLEMKFVYDNGALKLSQIRDIRQLEKFIAEAAQSQEKEHKIFEEILHFVQMDIIDHRTGRPKPKAIEDMENNFCTMFFKCEFFIKSGIPTEMIDEGSKIMQEEMNLLFQKSKHYESLKHSVEGAQKMFRCIMNGFCDPQSVEKQDRAGGSTIGPGLTSLLAYTHAQILCCGDNYSDVLVKRANCFADEIITASKFIAGLGHTDVAGILKLEEEINKDGLDIKEKASKQRVLDELVERHGRMQVAQTALRMIVGALFFDFLSLKALLLELSTANQWDMTLRDAQAAELDSLTRDHESKVDALCAEYDVGREELREKKQVTGEALKKTDPFLDELEPLEKEFTSNKADLDSRHCREQHGLRDLRALDDGVRDTIFLGDECDGNDREARERIDALRDTPDLRNMNWAALCVGMDYMLLENVLVERDLTLKERTCLAAKCKTGSMFDYEIMQDKSSMNAPTAAIFSKVREGFEKNLHDAYDDANRVQKRTDTLIERLKARRTPQSEMEKFVSEFIAERAAGGHRYCARSIRGLLNDSAAVSYLLRKHVFPGSMIWSEFETLLASNVVALHEPDSNADYSPLISFLRTKL
eukprot:g508.t1